MRRALIIISMFVIADWAVYDLHNLRVVTHELLSIVSLSRGAMALK